MKPTKTGQPKPIRHFKEGPAPDPKGNRAERRRAKKLGIKAKGEQ